MKVKFNEWLHEEWEEGMPMNLQEALESAGIPREEWGPLEQKAGRPFYEVTMECEIDTETGKVEILKAYIDDI